MKYQLSRDEQEGNKFILNAVDNFLTGSKLTFQVAPESRRAHAGVMAKEMAEIKFAGKT